ncbi:peptidoglycan-binding domain-containing protein [Streptomyces sp. ACA25]|uniref:peptidoglycan-binding domain-containing protein n=1 Tax=Streptomyces sp. ACA25 TaxID=3022596 RepID=UPI002307C505|nr:peptidoglycan-binding domain-containing protein [Streptomyces sp. ACA25]MDB1086418.1 peptidoglycan-binding domain-containing protein [Streptomyces sp. ACA25]
MSANEKPLGPQHVGTAAESRPGREDQDGRALTEPPGATGAAPGPDRPDNPGASAEPGGSGLSELARRRRWVAGLVVGAVALAAGGAGASQLIKSPQQAAADAAAPPPSVITAPVEYRVLTDSVLVRGEVVPGQSVDVTAGAAEEGAPVVTRLPLSAGDPVEAGALLAEVSGRPVFALPGELPAYRDLRPGAVGDDVRQLQKALSGLGHDTGGHDPVGVFGEGTKQALNAFYSGLGYEPRPALEGDGAEVRAAEEAVKSAGRQHELARDALADAEAGGTGPADGPTGEREPGSGETAGSGAAGTGGGDPLRDLRRQAEWARADLAEAEAALAEAKATEGPMLPAGEAVYVEAFPARVDTVSAQIGALAAEALLTVSSGELVVRTWLPEHQKDLVRTGQNGEIFSEVSRITVAAEVMSVARTRSTATGEDGQASGADGYLMVVEPAEELPGELAGQDVRLTIEAASTETPELVVPAAAITSTAGGETVVTVSEEDGRRQVRVTPGTSGEGFVAVVPARDDELSAGERVITGVPAGQRQ